MTPENFVYWLKGLIEDCNKLEPKKFKKIKEKLAEVTGDKQTETKLPSLADIRSDISWSPYWSSWSSHPMKGYNLVPKNAKSDPPVPDYKQGESV